MDEDIYTLPVLGGGTVRLDRGDWHKARDYVWMLHEHGYCWGYVDNRLVLIHRWLMGEPPGLDVDHRNHDKLDNRRANLRVCTRADNMKNRRLRSDSVSGYKGVGGSPKGRWVAKITSDGRRLHLGTFDTAEEAARAYDGAARELHGEFALLNFNTVGHSLSATWQNSQS